jgi:putative colanic acid biosynthesis UDP-glucose lipid carrier transferase
MSGRWYPLFLYVKEKINPIIDPGGIIATLYLILVAFGEENLATYNNLFIISFFVGLLAFSKPPSFLHLGINGYAGKAVQVLFAWMAFAIIVGVIIYYQKDSINYNINAIIVWLVVTPIFGVAVRFITTYSARAVVSKLAEPRRAVYIGNSKTAQILACKVASNRLLNIVVDGYFEDRLQSRNVLEEKDYCKFCSRRDKKLCHIKLSTNLGTIRDATEYIINNKINILYITLPLTSNERIRSIMTDLQDTQAAIYFVPDVFSMELVHPSATTLDGIPLLGVNESPFTGINYAVKRLSDLVLASLIISVISPLLLLIYTALKASSVREPIFKQSRYGVDGKEFTIYKFRTMNVAEDGASVIQATKDDIRVTPIGKFLRKYSLDELPQLFNVVQGRMSLVGPRPHAVVHNELYRKKIRKYMRRHIIKPGLTGLAQINGFRGETPHNENMEGRLYYDLLYISKWSFALDIYILVKTMRVIWRDAKAY